MEKGAVIERGIIADVTEDGYLVASFDRDGIISPPIKSIGGTEYEKADLFYFFLFRDGTGKILCAIG